MKFKLTLRNKFTGSIESSYVEANSDSDARESIEDPNLQILTCRPIRLIGEKEPKVEKSVYVNTFKLRNRVERDLANRQMGTGCYSPEALAVARVKEKLKLQAELDQELGQTE